MITEEEILKETEEAEDEKEAVEEVLEAETETVDEAVEEIFETGTEVVTLEEASKTPAAPFLLFSTLEEVISVIFISNSFIDIFAQVEPAKEKDQNHDDIDDYRRFRGGGGLVVRCRTKKPMWLWREWRGPWWWRARRT